MEIKSQCYQEEVALFNEIPANKCYQKQN